MAHPARPPSFSSSFLFLFFFFPLSFLCFFYQSPRTILESKIPRVARGKRRDFRRLISVPRSVVRANRANRFQVRRGILYPRIVVLLLPSFFRSLSPLLSLSVSLSGWPRCTLSYHTPSSRAIPEFVITESREPRNRNFAGYDIRPKSKETRRKGTLYPPPSMDGERWLESNLQTSCTSRQKAPSDA